MSEIIEILDMLDWHMPQIVQARGISLAKNAGTIIPFIQPLTQRHSKNVWENCAIIIAKKNDEELKPYLSELLEWLQDMNWPGAFRIFDRLKKYSDSDFLQNAIATCIRKAEKLNDEVWKENLYLLIMPQQ